MTELKEDLMFLLDEANSEFSLANFKAGGSLSYTEELGIMADLLIARGVMIPVWCKDCKYFYRDDEFNRAWCGYDKCVANEVAVNGYCYRGERKENDCG